ncbi:MAG TPA: DnaJ family domain-containing protein [Jiangellales bacterium]|nr:DnaJ family domain-containing protein [Jiangellales bacterium]
MTERKPPGMSSESWVEKQIREAQERGEFDDLPGAGKPLPGLTGHYDEMWWVKEAVRRENISALPPALALRKEAEDLAAGITDARSEAAVRDLVADHNARVLDVLRRPQEGPPVVPHKLDADAVVAAWRQRRAKRQAQARAARRATEAGGSADPDPTEGTPAPRDSGPHADVDDLRALLGGRRGAIEATLPALVFVVAVSVRIPLPASLAAAVVTATVVAVLRWRRAQSARAGLLGLLGVLVAALIVMRTGRAVDFFAVQVLSNLASAVAWALSIALRRPLLGIVVGTILRQGPRWRSDPDLLRAYTRASWWWVSSYVLRVAIFVPLWAAGSLVALGVARVLLSWPLIAAVLALSWHTVRRTLPAGHPGIRHPVVPSAGDREADA